MLKTMPLLGSYSDGGVVGVTLLAPSEVSGTRQRRVALSASADCFSFVFYFYSVLVEVDGATCVTLLTHCHQVM